VNLFLVDETDILLEDFNATLREANELDFDDVALSENLAAEVDEQSFELKKDHSLTQTRKTVAADFKEALKVHESPMIIRDTVSSKGNSPPVHGTCESSTKKMHEMLSSSQKKRAGQCKTVKPFMIEPKVIYLKNKRDNVLMMTEKRDRDLPIDEHAYYGGFSPARKGEYKGTDLAKKYQKVRRNRKASFRVDNSIDSNNLSRQKINEQHYQNDSLSKVIADDLIIVDQAPNAQSISFDSDLKHNEPSVGSIFNNNYRDVEKRHQKAPSQFGDDRSSFSQ